MAAVSANVNYDVEGDGSAIFNAFNPCGLFRVGGDCSFGDPFTPGGQSITKTFVDEAGDAVAGVNFTIVNTEGSANYQATSVSGLDGSRTFSNVPVGVYELLVNSVPAGYVLPTGAQETIVVTEGADVEVTNTLTWAQGFTKAVCIGEPDGFEIGEADLFQVDPAEVGCYADAEAGFAPQYLGGVDVVVYENIGEDFLGAPVAGEIVYEGQTGADGSVGANLAPGNYILCIFDADGAATTANGEIVDTFLPDEATVTLLCATEILDLVAFDLFGDLFTVEAGVVTELVNPVALDEGVLNIFVYELGTDSTSGVQTPVEGVVLCEDGIPVGQPGANCTTTDANGSATFVDTPDNFSTWGTVYAGAPAAQILTVIDAEGGDETASNVVVSGNTVNFDYEANEDVGQDGYLNDVNEDGTLAGTGTFDLNIQVSIEEINGQG